MKIAINTVRVIRDRSLALPLLQSTHCLLDVIGHLAQEGVDRQAKVALAASHVNALLGIMDPCFEEDVSVLTALSEAMECWSERCPS